MKRAEASQRSRPALKSLRNGSSRWTEERNVLFGNLAEKLQNALGKLRGRGKLTEKDVDQALREVRLALLEADVNFRVARDFIARIKERAIGHEVMESLRSEERRVGKERM